MEVIPNNPLLRVTKEDLEFARNSYVITDIQRINESIDAIIEWMQKQDHLVESSKHTSREYLERIYMLALGSTENAKKKIDKLFTMRGMVPEICLHRTPGEFERLLSCVKFVPMPKLVPKDRTRVLVTQVIGKTIDDFSLLEYCRYGNMIGEYRMYHDYNAGDRFICDLNGVSIISKMNPVVMKKYDLIGEAYATKVKSVHIINGPPYIDTLVSLLKTAMRNKVAGRLHVHSSYEDLYEYIDKEVLPEDYGGDELPIAKLAEKWKEHLSKPEMIQWMEDQDKLVSDESKRSSNNFNQEYMGMPGSFRKLNVD
ncbi:hypothetical protein ABMA27_008520 [Loxostege sticticalis]|uniref:CRAL-TRIO domain-containing protein n=1 Tax=Loxostege sticticalis TaxID=481309 RepID=A0ABR3HBM2_LOXSC